MKKYMNIYGDKFGTLFAGIVPEGKILDTRATERGMQEDLDVAKLEWHQANQDADEETERIAYDMIGERMASDASWNDSNLVWIDE